MYGIHSNVHRMDVVCVCVCVCLLVLLVSLFCAVGQSVCIVTTRPKAKHSQEIQRVATQHNTTPHQMPCRAVHCSLIHSVLSVFFRSVLVLIILFFREFMIHDFKSNVSKRLYRIKKKRTSQILL